MMRSSTPNKEEREKERNKKKIVRLDRNFISSFRRGQTPWCENYWFFLSAWCIMCLDLVSLRHSLCIWRHLLSAVTVIDRLHQQCLTCGSLACAVRSFRGDDVFPAFPIALLSPLHCQGRWNREIETEWLIEWAARSDRDATGCGESFLIEITIRVRNFT